MNRRLRLTWVGIGLMMAFWIGALILNNSHQLPEWVAGVGRLLVAPWYAGLLAIAIALSRVITGDSLPWYLTHGILLSLFVLGDLIWMRLGRRRFAHARGTS